MAPIGKFRHNWNRDRLDIRPGDRCGDIIVSGVSGGLVGFFCLIYSLIMSGRYILIGGDSAVSWITDTLLDHSSG